MHTFSRHHPLMLTHCIGQLFVTIVAASGRPQYKGMNDSGSLLWKLLLHDWLGLRWWSSAGRVLRQQETGRVSACHYLSPYKAMRIQPQELHPSDLIQLNHFPKAPPVNTVIRWSFCHFSTINRTNPIRGLTLWFKGQTRQQHLPTVLFCLPKSCPDHKDDVPYPKDSISLQKS